MSRRIPIEVESLIEATQSIMNVRFLCTFASEDFLRGEIHPVAIFENESPIFEEGEDRQEMETFLVELLGSEKFALLKERAKLLAQAQI